MNEAFIIMQIGNADLDRVCDEVIVPAIQAAGLIPRRVDRDNAGDLLKAEIIAFLERAQIIVADLTNERPNCYLEVGYAMGLGKKRNLLLLCREDHHHRSPNYRTDGPRVHFDLEGYDLLLWDPANIDEFRTELKIRIRRRLAILEPAPTEEPAKVPVMKAVPEDAEWIQAQRERALGGLASVERGGYMQATVALHPKGSWRQPALLSAVEASQIKTFGWPIAITLNKDPWRAHPTAEGVRAEVAITSDSSTLGRNSYDYWYLRQTGDFYFLQSLFEDERRDNAIFFNTRIVRVTEMLLFLSRLYSRLELPDSTRLKISVTHGGLKGRTLGAVGNRILSYERITNEDTVMATIECALAQIEAELVQLVRALLDPLFVVFDFFEVADETWSEIIEGFVAGEVK